MKSKHNQPYYKKVYSRDTKNLKILIGHGYKQPKYAKKGGPFKLNPPKRRPVGKLSAPPMVLDEEEQTQKVINNTEAFLLGLQNGKQGDILKFYVKERQNLNPGSFCPGDQEYSANFISDDEIEVVASFVVVGDNCESSETKKQTKTKVDVLATFKNTVGNKDICAVLDCKNSTWNGKRLDTALNKLKQQASLQQKPKTKTQEKPKTKTQEKRAKDLRTSSAVVSSIAKGENVDAVLEKDLFASYGTSPYHPVAKEFSEKFNKLINKSLEKISDPDEKKMAALTAVIFGTIGMNVTSAIAETAALVPKEYYQEATKVLGALVGTMGADFLKLADLYDTMVKGEAGKVVRGFIKKAVGDVGGPAGLPDGEGKKIIYLGNSQAVRTSRALNRILTAKNYDTANSKLYTSGKFDLVHSGDTNASHPSYYHKGNKGFSTVEKLVAKLGGPDKVGLISVNMGDAQDVGTWESATDKMIKDLRGLVPGVAIFWMGAPPIQKKVPKTNQKRKRNTLDAKKAVERNGGVFVNPFDFLKVNAVTRRTLYVQDPEKVHLNTAGIIKVLSGSAFESKKTEKKPKSKTIGGVKAIRYDGERAVKLPSGEIRVGGTAAWRRNNPGNLKLRTAWRFYDAVGRANGFAVFATAEAGEAALDKYLNIWAWKSTSKYTIETFFKMYDEPKWEIYSKNVAKAVGVDVTKKTKDLNEKQKEKFKEAIKRQEGYKAGTVIPAREEESYA